MIQFLYQQNPKAFRRYLHILALRASGKRPEAALAYEFQMTFGDFPQVERKRQEYLQDLAGTKVADL